jgi:hypothetical protein
MFSADAKNLSDASTPVVAERFFVPPGGLACGRQDSERRVNVATLSAG